ncbi:AIG2 family [Fusarium napiforme]|uniref:gamma-glutamylcyclotransferase n=1 Tax=Fusarium napiforme TaxID=42672 RepID=A0A8H5J4L9_9HYPO|nr:AIG2 family [Fusarium napiforme]
MPDLPAQLYFAYGSNLWLQQMASRCPESYYVGRAVLMDHRWQINSRGFANVIPCSGYNVHGLVYQVSVDDEARLDRNEGVHSGAYTKSYHSVVLHEAVEDLQLPTRYLVQDGGLDKAVNAVRSGSRSHNPEEQGRIRSNVLVYLSSRHSQWGTARDEYIDRMNCGIRDAVTLGIPSDFFENTCLSAPRLNLGTECKHFPKGFKTVFTINLLDVGVAMKLSGVRLTVFTSAHWNM